MSKKVKVYYQEGYGYTGYILNGSRVRYIYPNGRVTWQSVGRPGDEGFFTLGEAPVCWQDDFSSAAQAIKAMRKFDKQCGFPKAILIGEV